MASNFLYTSSNQKSELSIPDSIITLFPSAKKKRTNIFPSITKIYFSTELKTEPKNIFSPSLVRRELK